MPNFYVLEHEGMGGIYLSTIKAKDLEEAWEKAEQGYIHIFSSVIVLGETDALKVRDWLNKVLNDR